METLIKNQTSPTKKDLSEGNVVPIYDREEDYKGRAKLLYLAKSRTVENHLPFIMHEDKRGERVWSYERWVVEWVQHDYYRRGDRNVTEVVYFVKHEVF